MPHKQGQQLRGDNSLQLCSISASNLAFCFQIQCHNLKIGIKIATCIRWRHYLEVEVDARHYVVVNTYQVVRPCTGV